MLSSRNTIDENIESAGNVTDSSIKDELNSQSTARESQVKIQERKTLTPEQIEKLFPSGSISDGQKNIATQTVDFNKSTVESRVSFGKTSVIDNLDMIQSNRIQHKDDNDDTKNFSSNKDDDDDTFDKFVLENFPVYSGNSNVNDWLDTIEEKFIELKLGRKQRLTICLLIIKGTAKQKYIKNRHSIRSYDDFYAFLLSEFENTVKTSGTTSSTSGIHTPADSFSVSTQMNTSIERNVSALENINTLHLTNQKPMFNSTAVDTISSVAKPFVQQSTVNTVNTANNTSDLFNDQTLNDLRKVMVSDFFKNPKTFKGGKDDVTKWVDDIEHLFNVALIPNHLKLNLISCTLRGDAMEWYKNVKHSINSWEDFVKEVKQAFTSSYHEEIAFKKLEIYTQGENQSVRSFYNEILKLCREADPQMSEATKLKNLISKTKPQIQIEVRKRKPTTISQYLEYARDTEELFQLSNMTFDLNTHSNQGNQSVRQQPNANFRSDRNNTWKKTSQRDSFEYSSQDVRNRSENNHFRSNPDNNRNYNDKSFSNSQDRNKVFSNNDSKSQPTKKPLPNDSNRSNVRNESNFRNDKSNEKNRTTSTITACDIEGQLNSTEIASFSEETIFCDRCQAEGHTSVLCPHF